VIARPPSRLSRHNAADIRDSASRAHARLLDHQASGGFAEVSNAVADPTRISATRISPAAVADLEATARVRALALQALSSVDPAIVGRTYVHPRVGTVSSADLVDDDGTQADPSRYSNRWILEPRLMASVWMCSWTLCKWSRSLRRV